MRGKRKRSSVLDEVAPYYPRAYEAVLRALKQSLPVREDFCVMVTCRFELMQARLMFADNWPVTPRGFTACFNHNRADDAVGETPSNSSPS